MVMERVPRSGRELLAPQTVDERVDVDHPTLPEREHRQQSLALRAAHVRERPARENLERAEKPNFEQLLHTRLASSDESRRLERWHPAVPALALRWHHPGARSSRPDDEGDSR